MKPAAGMLMWCGFFDMEVRRRPSRSMCLEGNAVVASWGRGAERDGVRVSLMDAVWTPHLHRSDGYRR